MGNREWQPCKKTRRCSIAPWWTVPHHEYVPEGKCNFLLGRWRGRVANVAEGLPTGNKRLPHRWGVERIFAWLGRCRRMTKDWETSIKSARAGTCLANIRILSVSHMTVLYANLCIEPQGYEVVPAENRRRCLWRSQVSTRLSMLERPFLIA